MGRTLVAGTPGPSAHIVGRQLATPEARVGTYSSELGMAPGHAVAATIAMRRGFLWSWWRSAPGWLAR